LIETLKMTNLLITGTLTIPAGPDNPVAQKFVFQGASNVNANYFTATGQPRKVRRHVIPRDPKTLSQLVRRAHMAAGVAQWQQLPVSSKATWRIAGEQRNLTSFQAFISAWLKTPPAFFSTSWDAGSTLWDSTPTLWDGMTDTQWDGGATLWRSTATSWL